MIFNILIVTKDISCQRRIIDTLRRQRDVKIIYSSYNGFTNMVKTISQKKVGIIFIDTEVLRSHVVTCLKIISRKFKNMYIILISNKIKYVDAAFDIMASGYILKPVRDKEILNCFIRIKNSMEEAKFNGIIIRHRKRDVFLIYEDIIYIEASNRKSIIHTTDIDYTVTKNIKDIITELPSDIFFRSHRSYIINTKKIKYIECFKKTSYNVILKGDKIALLSRILLKDLKSRFNFSSIKKTKY